MQSNRPLHRIGEVRQQQGVSVRSVARQLHVDIRTVRSQEDPAADLSLTTLYQWQRILDVPVAHLLVDLDAPLSEPVLRRAQLLRLMKTATAIQDKTRNVRIQRIAQMLIDQLIEIMPELQHVNACVD